MLINLDYTVPLYSAERQNNNNLKPKACNYNLQYWQFFHYLSVELSPPPLSSYPPQPVSLPPPLLRHS